MAGSMSHEPDIEWKIEPQCDDDEPHINKRSCATCRHGVNLLGDCRATRRYAASERSLSYSACGQAGNLW